jgi:hypothetical protein
MTDHPTSLGDERIAEIRREAEQQLENAKHITADLFAANVPPNGWTVFWKQDAPVLHMRWTDGMRPEIEARIEAECKFFAAAPRLVRQLLAALTTLRAEAEARQRIDIPGAYQAPGVEELAAKKAAHCAEAEAREQAAIAEGRRQEREAISGASSEWFVCFHCWIAYHVPTTGYYGACQQCGHDTKRWPANPLETLRMMELNLSRKPSAQSEVER